MKIKKWLLGTVLSLCLLMNTLAMPAASAGALEDFAGKNFPTIMALQEKMENRNAFQESLEYFARWHDLVDQGIAKLGEWGDMLKEKGMTDVLVIGGGVIPDADIPGLKAAGIAEVFTPGTPTSKVVDFINANVK